MKFITTTESHKKIQYKQAGRERKRPNQKKNFICKLCKHSVVLKLINKVSSKVEVYRERGWIKSCFVHPEISRFKQKWVRLRRQLGEMRAGDFAAAPFRLTAKASSCRASAPRQQSERQMNERRTAVLLLPLAPTQHISELSYMGRNLLRALERWHDWILYLLAGGAEPPSSLPRDGRQQGSTDTDVKLKSNLSHFRSNTHLCPGNRYILTMPCFM